MAMVNENHFCRVKKLKQDIDFDKRIVFKSEMDRTYALGCVEEFLYYWLQFKAFNHPHDSHICMKAYRNLRNVGLVV